MMKFGVPSLGAVLFLLPISVLTGCATKNTGGGGSSSSGGGSTVTYPDSTGNWVVQATATSKAAPFTQLTGYINEQRTGSTNQTTGTFGLVSTGCYATVENIPMQGVIQGLRLHLVSFGLDQQVLDLSAAKDTTSTHFTGTYAVTGGCADGAAGTLTGTRYNALTGTYAGVITGYSPQQTLTLKLTQYTLGTGDGKFLINGTATLAAGCSSSWTLAADDGVVSGSQVQMHFTTPQGSTMDVVGDFDTGASTITASSITFTGTGCPGGSPGTATLVKG